MAAPTPSLTVDRYLYLNLYFFPSDSVRGSCLPPTVFTFALDPQPFLPPSGMQRIPSS